MHRKHLPWQPGPASPELAPDDLHLWLAQLDLSDHDVRALYQTLSPDEQARARKFQFADDTRRFAVARGALRAILSSYIGRSPKEVKFEYSSFGKPRLTAEPGQSAASFSFNLSHSGELALYAIGLQRRIGVDIEQLRPQIAEEHIAEHFFSPREVHMLRQLPPNEQVPAFFRCWTRKEAYVKARGEGLSIPLNRFDVTLRPDEPAALLSTADGIDEVSRWTLHAVDIAPGYEAAVAVEGEVTTLRQWLFSLSP